MNLDGAPNERDRQGYADIEDMPLDSTWADGEPDAEEVLTDGITAVGADRDLDDGALIASENISAARGRELRSNADDRGRVRVADSHHEQLVEIKAIKEPTDSDDQTNYDQPIVGNIVAAARRGATMRYELERKTENGPIKERITPNMRPPEAEVVAATRRSDEDPQRADKTAQEQDQLWVRFERQDIPTDGADTPDDAPEETPLSVKDLLESYDGPFKLVIEAKGVPPGSEEYRRLHRSVRDAAHNASIFDGQEVEESILTARRDKVALAAGTALVRVSVAVTAPEEELAHVTSLVEGALPTNKNGTWAAEQEDMALVGYTSERAALDAPEKEPGALHMEARDFRKGIKYVDVETAGRQVVKRQHMSVEQDLPPDTHSFRIGQRLDNLFSRAGIRRIAGELLMPARDLLKHTLVFGATNSGKTEFVRQLLAGAKLDNFKRRQAGEDILPLSIVTIDFKKGGDESNFGQPLADRLASFGLPASEAIVNRIRPGEGGLRPVLDLCDPTNSSPARQAERIIHSVLIGVSSGTGSGMSGADGETQRILERYIKDGVEAAYKELGWNLDTDSFDTPWTPPHPTMAQIAHKIREAFDDKSYDDKAKGNLSEFNAGQFENQLKLLPGRFFKDGHPIDFEEVLNNPGVTAFEFDLLGSNDTARKVAAVGIIQEIEKVVDARHAAMGLTGGMGVDEAEVVIALDEAAKIFDMTPAGQTTAEFLTRLRSKGIAFVISQQLIEGMNPTALRNIGNVFGMRSSEAAIAAEHKLFGEVTVEELEFLSSKEVRDARGLGLAYLAGVNGPVGFQSIRTSELPERTGPEVSDARKLVNVGPYGSHYSGETIARANTFLNEKRDGNLISAWAEINVALTLSGREPAKVDGELRENLLEMRDADMRDAAIIEAVRSAVDARVAALYPTSGPDGIKEYLIDKMLTQARGGHVEDIDVRFDLCLDHGYYSRVKDVVENALTANKLEKTEEYEEFFGTTAGKIVGIDAPPQEIKISGATAAEQKSNLEKLERESVKAIRKVVAAGEKRDNTRQETEQAQVALIRLVGNPSDAQAVAYVVEKLRLSHDQAKVFDAILSKMPADRLDQTSAGRLSILSMRRALDQVIKEKYDTTEAQDLGEWSRTVYVGKDFRVPSGLAKDQMKLIEGLESDRLKDCDYEDEIDLLDQIIATDLRNGGLALDNAVAGLARKAMPGTKSHVRARRVITEGRDEKLTIAELAKNMKVDDWAGVASRDVLYGRNPNFRYTRGAKRWLVKQINDHVRDLRQIAEEERAKQKPGQGQPQGA